MHKTLCDFSASQGLALTRAQLEKLDLLAQLVWRQKEKLNLTSVENIQEIYTRHLCDGLAGAAQAARFGQKHSKTSFTLADMGAGAGYIGLVCAIALPQAQVTLVESLEKRCLFMNWAIVQLGLTNAQVKNVRLGQGTDFTFDLVTERAMGKLADILPLCLAAIKEGGLFMPYQSTQEEGLCSTPPCTGFVAYTLPGETKERFLALFVKD